MRKATSMGKLVDSPQPSELTTKPAIMITNRLRLPSILPNQPSSGMTSVRVTRNPVATHWVVARSVPKVTMRRGMAIFRLVPEKIWVAHASSTMPATSHL
jgi:hypothetical protein